MKLFSAMVNGGWIGAQGPSYLSFSAGLRHPEWAQQAILLRYLRANAETCFGQRHQFRSIRSVQEFQERVPLSTFEDYAESIGQVRAGAANVLTSEAVRCLQPSSGSTRAAKLIPYTSALQSEFGRAVGPWMFDLARSTPAILAGPAYWSVSPLRTQEIDGAAVSRPVPASARTPAVGFESDSAYLGGWLERLVRRALVDCEDLKYAQDIGEFRRRTLVRLLNEPELRVISVWHPTFLTLLLDELAACWDELLALVAKGMPGAGRLRSIPPNRRRADRLRPVDPGSGSELWPHLATISCWGDGHAAGLIANLKRRFPGVRIQPKGLIATEAVVSIPFEDGFPVAIRSHFFEFIDDRGAARTVSELEKASTYSVVVTTGGGLYRYQLRDRIRVEDFIHSTPSIRFVGKEDSVSDMCGEKLSEGLVADVLSRLLPAHAPAACFALMAPDISRGVPRYVLYLESQQRVSGRLSGELEGALHLNPNYALCIRLGQLHPAQVEAVAPGSGERYLERLRVQGQRLGDIKPAALSPLTDWHSVFCGAQGPNA
jgi:GH3 auxin-responsive promoter